MSWSQQLNTQVCVSLTMMAVSVRSHRSPIPDDGGGGFLVVMLAAGGGRYWIEETGGDCCRCDGRVRRWGRLGEDRVRMEWW